LVAQRSPPATRKELVHVRDVEVADTPSADPAPIAQVLERLDRLFERDIAAPVQQVAVEVVETEPLEASLARRGGGARAGVVRVDLADDEELVARHRARAQRSGERLADDPFGAAFAVHLGGVDDAPAHVDRGANGSDLALSPRRRLAHPPGAEAERRQLAVAGECHHGGSAARRGGW
jgi:hypothetical protein